MDPLQSAPAALLLISRDATSELVLMHRLLTLLACVSLASVANFSPAQSAELRRGRCYMDECSWFSIEDQDLIGSSPRGALFRVTLKGWTSHHPDGRYDQRAPRRGGEATTSYVFCSKTQPAMITPGERGRLQVDDLALNTPDGPPGVLESTFAVYYAVCHAVGANTPADFIRLGRRYGYPSSENGGGGSDTVLKQPSDILKQ